MATKNFLGKVVLITGASSGIGRAAALALAEQGARLALAARSAGLLQETAEAARSRGAEALALPTDVTDRAQVDCFVQAALERWGRVDVLLSNAGQYVRARALEMREEDLRRSMAVNLYGHYYAVQAVLPAMLCQGEGHILLVASMDAKKGIPPDGPYVIAKYALSGYGEVLRQELRPRGIAVTTLYPGRIDTPMVADLQVPSISAKISSEAAAQSILRAMRTRPAEMIFPPQSFLLYWVNVFSPRLADLLVRKLRLEGWQVDARQQGASNK